MELLLALFFWVGASGYFQWQDKTCVGLASRHSRKIGDQMEKVADAAALAEVQHQASRV